MYNRPRQNGGNVVSYFLTPEGLVINAVVGPANAEKVLSEAQWSQRLFEQVSQLPRQSALGPVELVRQAHLARMNGARRNGAQRNDPVHAYLAENPLAPLDQVYRRVFEGLANQKVAQDHAGAKAAAAALESARHSARPVLLVLYKGNSGQPDAATAQLLGRLASTVAARPLNGCLWWYRFPSTSYRRYP